MKQVTLLQFLLVCVVLVLLVAYYATKNGWALTGVAFFLLVTIALFYLYPPSSKPGEQVSY